MVDCASCFYFDDCLAGMLFALESYLLGIKGIGFVAFDFANPELFLALCKLKNDSLSISSILVFSVLICSSFF